jgi:hypothetical protein
VEKRRLLHQLEKQERDFLGTKNEKQSKFMNSWKAQKMSLWLQFSVSIT